MIYSKGLEIKLEAILQKNLQNAKHYLNISHRSLISTTVSL